MKLLAIETSSIACSVALLLDDNIHTLHQIAPMQQSQLLLPTINELLYSLNVSLNQLDALAFGCGPGSFTGIRIATSVIQGLGYGLQLPIIPISSLAAMAQTAFAQYECKNQIVAIDARIQEVYWATYTINSQGFAVLKGKEKVSHPTDILVTEGWVGVGNAWEIYKDHISTEPTSLYPNVLPTATSIAQLAKIQYLNKTWVDAASAQPVYLRDDVAKKSGQK